MSIDFNINEALDKIETLIKTHGAEVIEAAARVVQVNALGDLLVGLICMVFVFVMIWFAFWPTREAARNRKSNDNLPLYNGVRATSYSRGWRTEDDEIHDQYAPVYFFTIIPGAIAAIFWLLNWLNIWMWVALVDPKLALAHKIMQGVTG